MSLSCGDPLLLGGDDVAGEHRQYRAVHRHRHAHPVERDAVEQDLHVLDRVDRHPGLADIADDPRMVAVVAAMGGEIEGDRQPHLPGRQIVAVEAVRTPRRSRTRNIAGSSTAGWRTSSRAARADRAETRAVPDAFDRREVGGGVERLDPDALGRHPVEAVERFAPQLRPRKSRPVIEGLCRKGAVIGHRLLPRADQDYMGAALSRPSAAPRRRVWRKTIAAVSSSTAPAWCAAASGIGTTSSRVAMPSATCSSATASSPCSASASRLRQDRALPRRPQQHDDDGRRHGQQAMVELHRRDVLEPVEQERVELGIAGGDQPAVHQRKGVVGQPGAGAGDKPAGDDRHGDEANEHGFGRRAASPALNLPRRAGPLQTMPSATQRIAA